LIDSPIDSPDSPGDTAVDSVFVIDSPPIDTQDSGSGAP
jgi:hypothetical protein